MVRATETIDSAINWSGDRDNKRATVLRSARINHNCVLPEQHTDQTKRTSAASPLSRGKKIIQNTCFEIKGVYLCLKLHCQSHTPPQRTPPTSLARSRLHYLSTYFPTRVQKTTFSPEQMRKHLTRPPQPASLRPLPPTSPPHANFPVEAAFVAAAGIEKALPSPTPYPLVGLLRNETFNRNLSWTECTKG
ncbi:hypothetical protein CDAR_50451 [Caerostris darwini]|uniref:Uncharacterized protein n=1 Tax=Caerostris darwini TaxID=1538125 RepID=A0AAV4UX68_9ARAC|nr:hypothetical protein CDAR_50451 [Caerostris darwini]